MTQTWIPTPYFCVEQESEPESSNVVLDLINLLWLERKRADAETFGCVLPEGRLPANQIARQTHVYHQLHGDGTRDRRPSHLPAR